MKTSAVFAPTANLEVAMIEDSRGLRALRDEWNALLQSSQSDCLFLTWEWVSTWWDVYGTRCRLHLMTARNCAGELVGLAPLKRVTCRFFRLWAYDVVEFIGSGVDVTPEYLDFIAAPGYESAVVDVFLNELVSDKTVSIIDLRPLPESSPHLERLRRFFASRRRYVRCTTESVCPVLRLPESREAFIAGRSRNYRKKIRESEKRCERDLHVKLEMSTTPEELRTDLAALIELHHRRWVHASRAFRSRHYVEFHERLAQLLLERGWMRLFSLKDSKPLAALYCFAYGGRYYYYQAGRDPTFPRHRLGLLLMHAVICRAIQEKATVFDFLSGDEPYKYHWADTNVRNLRLVCCLTLGARVTRALHRGGKRLNPRNYR